GSTEDGPNDRDRARPPVRPLATNVELDLHRALPRRAPRRGAITAPLTRLRHSGRISSIGLDPTAPVSIHRRKIRIRDDHLVAERLEVLRHPLALRRGFHHNAHRGPPPEQGGETVPRRREASIQPVTAVQHNPDLTFLLVKIEGTIRHGWSSPVRLQSA